MAKAAKKAVVVAPSKSVVVGGWRERAAQSIAAKKEVRAKLPQMTGNFLSFRNGSISLGGVKLDNPMPCIIMSYGFERTYYSKPYQPDVLTAPDCYSFDNVKPHEQAAVPQADRCAECRFNEFGSAQNGKGKACKEGARLVLMHFDSLESPEKIAAAPLVQAKLSVLNSKTFSNYIEIIEDEENPSWASVTSLECQPDPKSQYAVSFVKHTTELDDEVLDAISMRVDEADRLLTQAYPEVEQAPARAPKAPARRRKFQ